MPDRYKKRIIEHLHDARYQPRDESELAEALQIEKQERESFTQSVHELLRNGQVVLSDQQTLTLPPPGRDMTGTFKLHPRGFGFLIADSPTEHGDLFVPMQNVNGAMTGDHVRGKVIRDTRRAETGKSPFIGKIIEIIQRADKKYVGNLMKRGDYFYVQVDGKVFADPVAIRDPHAKNAKVGDKVVIEIIDYPSTDELAEGVIIEVLGESGEPSVETQAVIRAYGLAGAFPEEVQDQARQIARAYDDNSIPPQREDLTELFITTIDPPDAKDFDDAISIRRLEDEDEAAYELGVHIADVGSFVEVGTELDQEAYARGNSAYLPRLVVPMLPELLSNGVCSLQEGVNRYTKSVFIRYDKDGKVLSERFTRGVIRSSKRMTYLEAQALINDDIREAKKHARTEAKYPRELIAQVKLMDELARTIRKRRFSQGMISLNLPVVELVYDESGRVIDAVKEDDAFTHTIIEMFMVEANEAAARLFDSLDVPMIRRIHPDPDAHDLGDLRHFARVAGYNIPARPTRAELQTLLETVRDKPAEFAVHLAVLKTLSKAEYSPVLVGHFALASEHYTHFTSPIRRYPDLIVHRALDAFFDARDAQGTKTGLNRKKIAAALRNDPRVPDELKLTEMAKHCSTTERNAESAERDLRNYLVLELMSQMLGDDFAGTVTGVTGNGIFVQIDRFLVEGFIPLTDLPGDRKDQWRMNKQTGALVAQRSGRIIQLGSKFTVRISKVEPHRRVMELAILDTTSPSRKKRKQPEGAAQAHEETKKLKKIKGRDDRKLASHRRKGAGKKRKSGRKKRPDG